MSAILERATNINILTWECKHCHQPIAEHETVAYHLVAGILYGWCAHCFSRRAPAEKTISELPGAVSVRGPVASATA